MKRLLIDISDTVAELNLKIYETTIRNKQVFECIFKSEDGSYGAKLTLEEAMAALLFEGFNNIFVEDDTEYQTDEDKQKDVYKEIFEHFFNNLKKKDEDYFKKI